MVTDNLLYAVHWARRGHAEVSRADGVAVLMKERGYYRVQ